ncbi:hypothetical protein Bca52824_022810 [Brassica carinata]|uniref:SAC domain-containing protein n=1 Tax=Brassica carinata TaxID=52824 RepID=A0A8X7VGN2_BRACI|nr:hypothetical protein Bca52824_022810 [Brassica carinata]
MENGGSPLLGSMQEFKLFETQSNFYMIGWNGSGVYRVLKIDRLDASELNVSEDSTAYTKKECYELLKRIHEGNKATGGLKLVTLCYGIIGFIKFLGPYYMLVITERREIGDICGHRVYEVSKSEIISLQNSSVLCNIANSRDENSGPHKGLLFSYSYNIMRSFQKNMCDHESASGGTTLYKKMFVWNEFLTRGIRHHLRNTVWTVALVYGFFKQVRIYHITRLLGLEENGSVTQRNYEDLKYEATRLHFENLAERYGIPIIILNLIKFANAIDFINEDLPKENRLRFLHWDLHKHFQSKTANVLTLLGKVVVCALMLTGFFYYQVTPAMKLEGYMSLSSSDGEHDSVEKNFRPSKNVANDDYDNKPGRLQRGMLRSNCIDCLDRTNVAQYAYGWAALGQQLYALEIRDAPTIELDDPLSSSLMALYERMGDTLAYQLTIGERRVQWRAATQSQELLRTLQCYYNNTYMDADKQDAINIFLGTFQPEQGRQAVWELRSDSHSYGQNVEISMGQDERQVFFFGFESSHQVTHIISESSPDMPAAGYVALSRCTPSMPSTYFFGDARKVQHNGSNSNYLSEQEDMSSVSNFVDGYFTHDNIPNVEWLSSSENLCENDQLYRPPVLTSFSTAEMSSSENIISEAKQPAPAMSESSSTSRKGKEPMEAERSVHTKIRDYFTDSFKQWVACGEALCH